ncbi:Cell division protein FtsQ [Frankliniella fusca]|uniref:Cell division protein FtsQ n=1 Tax=Frankliniella fusca TaxID=407009 RepID=A0AAE1GTR0_9NEOP|nr:Cell division protein FtsQ [Frankliniella fusca]
MAPISFEPVEGVIIAYMCKAPSGAPLVSLQPFPYTAIRFHDFLYSSVGSMARSRARFCFDVCVLKPKPPLELETTRAVLVWVHVERSGVEKKETATHPSIQAVPRSIPL